MADEASGNREDKAAEQTQGTELPLAAHTPGPWTIDRGAKGWGIIRDSANRHICSYGGVRISVSESEANAALMVSAPALLIALEEAAQRLDARGHKFGAEQARAAITLASGGK